MIQEGKRNTFLNTFSVRESTEQRLAALLGLHSAETVVRWLLEMSKRRRFKKEHMKAELEWTTNCADQMDCALETLMMSCETAEYFQEAVWFFLVCGYLCGFFVGFFLGGVGGGSTDRDALNAFGSSSQYWCFASL